MADCKWCKDEICVNADCPMCCDYCPVPEDPGVCRYEDRDKLKDLIEIQQKEVACVANMNEDHLIRCPYYKTNNRQVIHCEGFEKGMVIHAAFSSYAKQVDWKARYCRKMSYRQCPISKALDEKYEYK